MKISYLTDNALATLRGQLPENLECYAANDHEFFYDIIDSMDGFVKDSSLEVPYFELDTTSDFSVSDVHNVRTLYSAMRNIPPSVACDERLWVGLAHGLFWHYVQYRQADQIASLDQGKIATSFFFTNGRRRSLYVNCLSRLWWAGHLTYDESNKEDPFALTDLIAKNAFPSTITLFSSSNMTANPNIGLGVLDSIRKRELAGDVIERKHFVGPLRYLNNMGGITILDIFSRAEITQLIDEYLATEEFANLKLTSKRKKQPPTKQQATSTTPRTAEARTPKPKDRAYEFAQMELDYIRSKANLQEEEEIERPADAIPPKLVETRKAYDPIIEAIEYYGFEYVDMRDEGGLLWVVANDEFEELAERFRNISVEFQYAIQGSAVVNGRPCWWTMDDSPE